MLRPLSITSFSIFSDVCDENVLVILIRVWNPAWPAFTVHFYADFSAASYPPHDTCVRQRGGGRTSYASHLTLILTLAFALRNGSKSPGPLSTRRRTRVRCGNCRTDCLVFDPPPTQIVRTLCEDTGQGRRRSSYAEEVSFK